MKEFAKVIVCYAAMAIVGVGTYEAIKIKDKVVRNIQVKQNAKQELARCEQEILDKVLYLKYIYGDLDNEEKA